MFKQYDDYSNIHDGTEEKSNLRKRRTFKTVQWIITVDNPRIICFEYPLKIRRSPLLFAIYKRFILDLFRRICLPGAATSSEAARTWCRPYRRRWCWPISSAQTILWTADSSWSNKNQTRYKTTTRAWPPTTTTTVPPRVATCFKKCLRSATCRIQRTP